MRWPWDHINDSDDESDDNILEVTVPAHEEVVKTQERLERINRILAESRQAEVLIRRMR